MNKERRKQIAELITQIEKVRDEAQTLAQSIGDIRDEEQDYYDNMPESFQQGEKGDAAQEAIDHLQTAADELEGFDFDTIIDYLESAKG